MSILQSGAPKSGNFWLYKIIQQILSRKGFDSTSYIERHPVYKIAREWDLNFPEQARIDVLEITDLQYRYRISSVFNMPIDDINEYISGSPHVWTHSPICKRSSELFQLFDKKIYIIRDPRDRAISASKYMCSDYMLKYFPQEETIPAIYLEKNFDHLMHEWVWHVYDHLRHSSKHNIHVIFFENLLSDFPQELDRLLNYLEISLDRQHKADLEEAVSFKVLKRKNPDHLKKGKAGYWAVQLSDEQVEKTNIIAGPLLKFLGYPSEVKEEGEISPAFKADGLESLKNGILASQQQLYNPTTHPAAGQ